MPDFPPKVRVDDTVVERESTYRLGQHLNVYLPDGWWARFELAFTGVQDNPVETGIEIDSITVFSGQDVGHQVGLDYETEVFDPILFQDDFEEDRSWEYYETLSGLIGSYVTDQYVSPTHSYKLEKPAGVVLPSGGGLL